MSQMKFRSVPLIAPEGKRVEFFKLVHNIFMSIEDGVKDKIILSRVITQDKELFRTDLKLEQAAEVFTEDKIIEPLFEFLGYGRPARRTGSGSSVERREADYTLTVGAKKVKVLVEAEPLNKVLETKDCGIDQVSKYLEKRSFKADYGIATEGFRWVLIKYDSESYRPVTLLDVDLTPFFLEECGQELIESTDEIFNIFYHGFSKDTILKTVEEVSTFLEESREAITKRFYSDYIGYVFGYDNKTKKHVYCLLDAITTPSDATEEQKRSFAVVLMNRLIFIKFLEDKELVEKKLLKTLLSEHKSAINPSSFYQTYVQKLFYEVFNTHKTKRNPRIRSISHFCDIPYLNGGLFRELIPKEKDYDVEDDILARIIDELLEGYCFTLNGDEEALNPDILGYVFEKTINYLTGPGKTEKRKEKGAFYTPEEVTSYISTQTIRPYLLGQIKEYLKLIGWKESDISGYPTMDVFLENIPINNPATIKQLYFLVDKIKVLDPACGSGHFLTSALKEIIFIKKHLIDASGMEYNYYLLKKETISNNIYGVDIEGAAVEIAKLRLWLSLIEDLDVSDLEKVETLPNIEYNIMCGNSLLGWYNEKIVQTMISSPFDLRIQGIFEGLEVLYVNDERYELLEESKKLISKEYGASVNDLKKAYAMLVAIYSQEEGERAVKLRYLLEYIRASIYKEITPSLNYHYLNKAGNLKSTLNGLADKNPFHWNVDFGDVLDGGGFDIVVGNPPYIRVDSLNKSEKAYYKVIFDSSELKYDIYYLFIESIYKWLKVGGMCGFIVPNKFTAAISAQTLREKIINCSSSCSIDSVSHLKIFEEAANYPVILFVQRGLNLDSIKLSYVNKQEDFENRNFIHYILKTKDLDHIPLKVFPININKDQYSLLLKILKTSSTRLLSKLKISEGLRIPASFEESSAKYKIVKQYQFEKLTPIRDGTCISAANLKSVISKKDNGRILNIRKKKILIQEDALFINATIDYDARIPQGGVYFGINTDEKVSLEYLLGLLSSALHSFVYQTLFGGMHMGGGYLRYRTGFLEQLPYLDTTSANSIKIGKIVCEIIDLNEQISKLTDLDEDKKQLLNKISIKQSELDQIVNALFSISDVEQQLLSNCFIKEIKEHNSVIDKDENLMDEEELSENE